MTCVGVWSWFPPPIWKAENEHGWRVPHCASAAEIFMGWYLASMTPRWLPTIRMSRATGTKTAMGQLCRAGECLDRAAPPPVPCGNQASMTSAPVRSEARTTWG